MCFMCFILSNLSMYSYIYTHQAYLEHGHQPIEKDDVLSFPTQLDVWIIPQNVKEDDEAGPGDSDYYLSDDSVEIEKGEFGAVDTIGNIEDKLIKSKGAGII